jgi:hypothetical protein
MYGQAILLDFEYGSLMKGLVYLDSMERDQVVAVNKVPNMRYSRQKELHSIMYFKNLSTQQIEKMVLGYKTQSRLINLLDNRFFQLNYY